MPAGHAERWQDAAIAGAALALSLTWMTSKPTPQQKADAAARKARRTSNVRPVRDVASSVRSESAGESIGDTPATPEVAPLQDERERLLKAGLPEHEVSQILVARASGARRNSFGSGVATGPLSNLEAVASYVRGHLIPNVTADLTRILDRDADSATRLGGALSFGVKAAAAVVVGYFEYLESLQFRASAYKAWADACIARQQAEINYSSVSELMSGATNGLNGDCKHQ